MKKSIAVLAAVAVLCTVALSATHAAEGSEGEATALAEGREATPKGAAAWPEGLRHKVSAGDTLWSLAAKYLDSPWKWGELWERNRFLTNPHYIYPGTEIVIFPASPKEFRVASPPAGAAPVPAEPPAAAESEPAAEPPVAAPARKPVPRPAPPPAGPPMLDIKPADFVRAGQFLRTLPKAAARIRGGEALRQGFSEGDKVFLTMKKPLPDGQLLGVYRARGPVTIPSARPYSGYVVYLVGILQVTGTEDGVVAGKVRFSFEEILQSDLISDEIPSYRPVRIDPGAEGLRATVVTGRRENREMATGDFIYLDKGAKSGVAVGNVFRIFSEDSGRMDESTQEVSPRVEVARAVVVGTTKTFATAYVVEGRQSFPAGVSAVRGVRR